jgi:hypothetical protein
MPTIINYVKKNTKNILIIVVALFMLPLIGFITETIFHLGTICGSYIRMLIENGTCF